MAAMERGGPCVLWSVRQNKERYAQAEAVARSRPVTRPPWFDIAMAQAIAGEAGPEA